MLNLLGHGHTWSGSADADTKIVFELGCDNFLGLVIEVRNFRNNRLKASLGVGDETAILIVFELC